VKAKWVTTTLGDLLSVQNGYAFDSKLFGAEGYPLIRIRDIKEGITTETKFSGSFDSKYVVNAGDFLIGMDGEFGCHEWKGPPALLNQRVCRLQGFHNSLEPRFLLHGINAHLKAIEEVTGYTTVKHLSSKQILAIEMLVPPRSEQHRIVTLLDEAFADIATAKANAEKNLQNARELFSSFVQSLFMTKEDGWFQTTIGEQLQLQRGFDITKDQQTEGTVPVVSSGGIKSYHDTSMVDGPGVVIGRKGTLGKSFFLETSFWPHDTTLWVKDFKGNEPKLVYHLLSSLDLKKLDSGAANPALNRNQVHPLKIWWPESTKQSDLIAIIDSMSGETTRLHEIYRQKLTALDDLKKSLLHQAFSGQL
jgi:type I restriction enzyme S subunit